MILYVKYTRVNDRHIFSSLAAPEVLTSDTDLNVAFTSVINRLKDKYAMLNPLKCEVTPLIPFNEWQLKPVSPIVFNIEFDEFRHLTQLSQSCILHKSTLLT